MHTDTKKRVAVVSGASRGIGRGCLEQLVADGSDLFSQKDA